ncbi:hypothetical protein F4803DRAFT_437599 [Xylaria telfairii]|nr:hypothetical protein F4803DRAFT_437599 [Xylaria telfairii]
MLQCCPDNFECDTTLCYAKTLSPATCNGNIGYYACGLDSGPGSCCPVGTDCNDRGGCDARPGVSVSFSCAADYFACPVTLGGGCCTNGWACGTGVCYNATPMTLPVSETKTTTDSKGHTTITVVTSLTIVTDLPNTSSGSPTIMEVPQLVPSTVAKVDAVQTSDSSSGGGGLSSGALGGIVTAVVLISVVVLAAATFMFLRLKKAERATRDAEKAAQSRRESDSQTRSQKSGFGQPTISEIGSMTDVDSSRMFPIMAPSSHTRSRSATTVTTDRSPSRTPNIINFGDGSSILSDGRQPSLDSYPRYDNGTNRVSQRISEDSRSPFGHGRKISDASELDDNSIPAEIYTPENNEAESQRRSNSISRPGITHSRRNSENRARGNSNAGAGTLGTVNEIVDLHGHYGPPHTAVGQTGANLDRGPSSPSSPTGPPSATRHQDP